MAVPSNAVSKLIAKVKQNVGRPGDTTLDDYAIEFINDTQKEVCNKANFWFMRADTTISVSQSDTSNALPSDFKDEDGFWIQDSNNNFIELEPMDYVDYRRKHDDVTEAQPGYYLLDGAGNVLFRPVADDSYTIVLDYWKYLADLVDAGSSNDLLDQYPDVLETGATYRTFRRYGELEDAGVWKTLYEQKLRDLVIANAERELPDEFVIAGRPDVFGATQGRIRNRR